MGILKFLNPMNAKEMINIFKVSDGLDKHLKKRCAYCDEEMGIGGDYPIIEFIDHLAEKHPDKIEPKDVETYNKIVKKLTK